MCTTVGHPLQLISEVYKFARFYLNKILFPDISMLSRPLTAMILSSSSVKKTFNDWFLRKWSKTLILTPVIQIPVIYRLIISLNDGVTLVTLWSANFMQRLESGKKFLRYLKTERLHTDQWTKGQMDKRDWLLWTP